MYSNHKKRKPRFVVFTLSAIRFHQYSNIGLYYPCLMANNMKQCFDNINQGENMESMFIHYYQLLQPSDTPPPPPSFLFNNS